MSENERRPEDDESVHNKHDKGYKHLLSSKKVFLELIRSFVKQSWVGLIDESDMVRVDKSYVLQDFDEKEADIVYRVKIKGVEVIFYVLMELQSTVDFQMPYRLLLYMTEIWRDVLKNTGKKEAERKEFRLPSIVPVVLYNGEGNWTALTRYKDLLSGYELFGDYVLDFKYMLIDVNRMDKRRLFKLSNLISSVFLLDQKVGLDELEKRLSRLVDVFRRLTPEEFNLLKEWMVNILVKGMPEGIKADVKKLIESSKEADSMVYNLEKTLKEVMTKERLEGKLEGKLEGIRQGEVKGKLDVARNLLLMGVDVEMICKATGLSEEEINKIKNETN